ncbi:hypothetical protein CEXT_646621 [Caerostris extrusa]|uniref:Uncharacterized protein n=1 Tax=Caerostris extrusa TaxID=172846 RepID=A0AAV4XIP3_CAEEX|nr:hypothetical protein CEXT_646621 [Caerostris extrusa]
MLSFDFGWMLFKLTKIFTSEFLSKGISNYCPNILLRFIGQIFFIVLEKEKLDLGQCSTHSVSQKGQSDHFDSINFVMEQPLEGKSTGLSAAETWRQS